MKSKHIARLKLFVVIFIAIFFVACGGDSPEEITSLGNGTTVSEQIEIAKPEQESIEEPTEAPEPTNTLAPTNTPAPTDTPEPTSTPTATPLPPTPTPLPVGLSRSNPYPITGIANAPNWDIQVLEIVRGEEAWLAIQSTNQFNDPPKEGMEYILVKIHAKSTYADDKAHSISSSDFHATGGRYIRYSSASVVEPDPQLDAEVFAGGETEGWVSFEVTEDETNLILIVDELFNFDEDRLRFIELEEGANVSIPEELVEIQPTDLGIERNNPAPFGEAITTGNREVAITDVIRGDDAWAMVQEVNQFNDPPKEGMEYILVKIYARSIYVDDKAHSISSSDFHATGGRYIRYSSASVVEPDPQLDAQLFAGGETEGWVAFEVAEGETNLILIVDELLNFDEDRLRFIELEEGANVSIPEELAGIQSTDLGVERSNPAPFGETIVTEDWEVTITDVIRGNDAWTMVQDANQFNDPPEEGMEYIAIKVLVRYISLVDDAESIGGSYFKSTGDVSVIYDSPSVVDPEPKLDISLYPGGESESWIVVQSAIDETGMKLIFEPLFDFSGYGKRFLSIEP